MYLPTIYSILMLYKTHYREVFEAISNLFVILTFQKSWVCLLVSDIRWKSHNANACNYSYVMQSLNSCFNIPCVAFFLLETNTKSRYLVDTEAFGIAVGIPGMTQSMGVKGQTKSIPKGEIISCICCKCVLVTYNQHFFSFRNRNLIVAYKIEETLKGLLPIFGRIQYSSSFFFSIVNYLFNSSILP